MNNLFTTIYDFGLNLTKNLYSHRHNDQKKMDMDMEVEIGK